MEGGGFEPPKLSRQIYSLIPLATREPLRQNFSSSHAFFSKNTSPTTGRKKSRQTEKPGPIEPTLSPLQKSEQNPTTASSHYQTAKDRRHIQRRKCCFLPLSSCNLTCFWSWREESNPRPADYKSAALPTELRQPDAHEKTDARFYWNSPYESTLIDVLSSTFTPFTGAALNFTCQRCQNQSWPELFLYASLGFFADFQPITAVYRRNTDNIGSKA